MLKLLKTPLFSREGVLEDLQEGSLKDIIYKKPPHLFYGPIELSTLLS